MKKLFGILFALSIMFAAFSGCEKDSDNTDDYGNVTGDGSTDIVSFAIADSQLAPYIKVKENGIDHTAHTVTLESKVSYNWQNIPCIIGLNSGATIAAGFSNSGSVLLQFYGGGETSSTYNNASFTVYNQGGSMKWTVNIIADTTSCITDEAIRGTYRQVDISKNWIIGKGNIKYNATYDTGEYALVRESDGTYSFFKEFSYNPDYSGSTGTLTALKSILSPITGNDRMFKITTDNVDTYIIKTGIEDTTMKGSIKGFF